MHNHFTITIHDLNGVKQFNLHQIIKKVILYVIAAVVVMIAVGASLIIFLHNSLDKIELKKTELQQQNTQLQQLIATTEGDLLAKKEELSVVTDRLEDIETLIGLAPQDESTLTDRVEIAKLTSAQRAALLKYIPNGSPVEYKGITSKYGYRIHPTLKRKEFHRGTDMRAKMKTPVYATADGIIEYSGYHKKSGYGNLVIIQHNYGFRTYFGHLNKVVIKSGTFVKKGTLIAYTGNSGMSSGPHLHYEIRFMSRPVNPFWFIKWSAQNYNEIFEKEKKIPWQSLITATAQIKVLNPTRAQLSSLLAPQLKGK